jgi:hypothetical protein
MRASREQDALTAAGQGVEGGMDRVSGAGERAAVAARRPWSWGGAGPWSWSRTGR